MSFMSLDDWRRSHNARWIDVEQRLSVLIRQDTGGRLDATRLSRLRAGSAQPRPDETRALMKMTNSQVLDFR